MSNEHWFIGLIKRYGFLTILFIIVIFIISVIGFAYFTAEPGGNISLLWGAVSYPKRISLNTGIATTPPNTPTIISYSPLIADNLSIIPVEIQGMGTKTGSVDQDGKTVHRIRVGDRGNNKESRGFIAFDISSVPQNVIITSAKLYLDIAWEGGDIERQDFHTLVLEAIDIEKDLDKDDFHKEGIIQNNHIQISLKDMKNNKSYEVNREILKFRELTRDYAVFRLRFTKPTDYDDKEDLLAIGYECCTTVLILEYIKSNN